MNRIFFRYFHNFASSGYSFDRALVRELQTFRADKGDNIRVLDFGCGMKPFGHLFQGVFEYSGIDVYPGKKVDIVYDGGVIPVQEKHYDLVFSSSVLEHVENLDFSLAEIARVLKPGGVLVSVVPFINHIHGTPYDFHRPTRFGWMSMLSKHFQVVSVSAVDNRWQCVCNVVTSAINNTLYDILRTARNRLVKREKVDIESGGASPESRQSLSWLYLVMKFNPVNFCIGLIALAMSTAGINGTEEGEITSGYVLIAKKGAGNESSV